MNYDFFDEVLVWNKKSASTNKNNIDILHLRDLDSIAIQRWRTAYNRLAKICGINVGGKAHLKGDFAHDRMISMTKENCNVSISMEELHITGKDFNVTYYNDDLSLIFQVFNKDGLYVYDYDGNLNFYDNETINYARNQGSSKDILKTIKKFGLKPTKKIPIRVLHDKRLLLYRKFDDIETIRLLELIRNDTSLKEIEEKINNEKKDLYIENPTIDSSKNKGTFDSNGDFKTEAHVIKGHDGIEEMLIQVTYRKDLQPKMFVHVYSVEGLGSLLISYLNINENTLNHFTGQSKKDGTQFESAYHELLATIAGDDNDELENVRHFPDSNFNWVYLRTEHHSMVHKIFTERTLQDGDILADLEELLPKGAIKTIAPEDEVVSTRLLSNEQEQAKKNNHARKLSRYYLKEAMDYLRKKAEDMKHKINSSHR